MVNWLSGLRIRMFLSDPDTGMYYKKAGTGFIKGRVRIRFGSSFPLIIYWLKLYYIDFFNKYWERKNSIFNRSDPCRVYPGPQPWQRPHNKYMKIIMEAAKKVILLKLFGFFCPPIDNNTYYTFTILRSC